VLPPIDVHRKSITPITALLFATYLQTTPMRAISGVCLIDKHRDITFALLVMYARHGAE
jgi:phage terminase large subunit-like protein